MGQQPVQDVGADPLHAGWRARPHRRRPGPPVQHAQLAEQVAGPADVEQHGGPPAVPGDLELAVQDDVHGVGRVALGHEHLAGRAARSACPPAASSATSRSGSWANSGEARSAAATSSIRPASPPGQPLVGEAHRHRALPHGRGDPLHRSRSARRRPRTPGHRRLERQRRHVERPLRRRRPRDRPRSARSRGRPAAPRRPASRSAAPARRRRRRRPRGPPAPRPAPQPQRLQPVLPDGPGHLGPGST